ncbi:MAG: iron-containing alcohol dehydrogenase [Bacillota bacterium]
MGDRVWGFFQFQLPTRVVAGTEVLSSLAEEVAALVARGEQPEPSCRVLLVTDRLLADAEPVAMVVDSLRQGGLEVEVFGEVAPDSSLDTVRLGAQAYREAGGGVLVAVGGGSSIDTAKAINMMVSTGQDILDLQGVGVLERPLGPLVAVPTTAGTGSEVTFFAMIRDTERGEKLPFVSAYLAPHLAVLAPQLTVGMSSFLTASTGIDALTHAVEAFLSGNRDPVSDALALRAAGLIGRFLPRATACGTDLEARAHMQVAACLAGMAFNHPMVGVVHALAHAVGGRYGVPHGLANAIFLAEGMRFNLPGNEERLIELGRAMGLPGMPAPGAAVPSQPQREDRGRAGEVAAGRVVDGVAAFIDSLGIQRSLGAAGVGEDAVPVVAELALADGSLAANPRWPEYDDLVAMVRAVL